MICIGVMIDVSTNEDVIVKRVIGFISFIINADPATALEHTNGFEDCAVGLYNRSVHHCRGPEALFNIMRVETLSSEQVIPTSHNYKDEHAYLLDSFLKDLGNSRFMTKNAPTMGKLVNFMDDVYPSIRTTILPLHA